MTNPKCPVCGHVNRVGAAACEMCDTRFGAAPGAGAAGSSREGGGTSDAAPGGGAPHADFGAAGEGFAGGGGEWRRDGSLPTDIPSPQFKGASDVISPTLEIYRKHFLLVGLLVLVTMLPLVLLQYWLYAAVNSAALVTEDGTIGAAAVGFGAGATLLHWALTTLGNALLSGALAYAVVQIQRAGSARAGESLLWGLGKMPKIVAVTVITYLLLYGAPAVVVALTAAVVGAPMAFIVLLLMILPWIVLMLTLSLAVPAVAVENRGVIESLTRSAELTRGNKGLIFLTYFLWWVVILLLNVVTTWSFYYSGGTEGSLAALLVQMLVGGMLSSSTLVLTVYIFLGALTEHRQGFAARAFTPGPEAAAR